MTRPAYDTHVCLVSDQAIPNLTPALSGELRPQRVVLVASDAAMVERAQWLQSIFSAHGMVVELRRLGSAVDFAIMAQDFQRIAAEFPDAALNATGGKKTMTLAAFQAFHAAGRPVFYVEHDNRLQWLAPDNLPDASLAAELDLRDMLAAHGQILDATGQAAKKEHLALAQRLIAQANRWARPLVTLGFDGTGEEKIIESKHGQLSSQQKQLLGMAVEHGLASRENGRWLCGKAEAVFLSGGWLEQCAAQAVREAGRDLATGEVFHGVKFHSVQNPEVKNEVDVAWVRENRLFIIECKAIIPKSKNKSLADFLYTLESVRKTGGLSARAALLTWGAEPGAGDRARADDNRIRIFTGATLAHLETALAVWIKSR